MKMAYGIVAVSGGVVLALEIIGTRVLGPFYGTSLFLWSALISVTLASLSLGYYVGGRVADRRPQLSLLSLIIASAGCWLIVLPFIVHPLPPLLEPIGLRPAVVLAAAILFGPPLILLGMVTPFAVRVSTTHLERVGTNAGALFAVSTLASVVGALLTGFLLIPTIGINKMLFLLALTLLVTALVSLLIEKRRGLPLLAVITLMMFSSFMTFAASDGARHGIATRQSPYAEIRVVDTEEGRVLLIDGTVHSLVDTLLWQSELEYVSVMEIPRYCYDRPGRMLLIGLGAGSLAKRYSLFGWTVDAMDIDPLVVDIAREYFNLRPQDANIAVGDGRRLLATSDKQYDVILIDAFGSSSIPFQLVSREAFSIIRQHLKPNGMIAINLWAMGWNDRIVRSVAATLRTAVTNVLAFPIAEPPNRLGNVVLIGRDSSLTLLNELERQYDFPGYRYSPMYFRVHAWDNQFEPDERDAQILTDDLNPIDIWSEVINYEARKELRKDSQLLR